MRIYTSIHQAGIRASAGRAGAWLQKVCTWKFGEPWAPHRHPLRIRRAALALVVLLGVELATAEQADVQNAGQHFVEMLVNNDFAGAVAGFDTTMKAAMPEARLRQTWQTLLKQVGSFKTQVRTRVETQGRYDIAFVTCQFEQSLLDVKVVYNTQRQVSGLFFVPSQGATKPWAKPDYANTNSFSERRFVVGQGEWTMPGTLSLPKGAPGHPVAAVVLVHGSGPNDRDETILANKPFRDLAWGLASRGIAVLRYEKRTKEHGAKIAADGKITVQEETIDDAVIAANQLRSIPGIDPKRVFVLGHSLGGLVAPRIGKADPELAGLIIMAGSTRPLEDLMVEQTRYILSLNKELPQSVADSKLAEMEGEVAKIKKLTNADSASTNSILGAPPVYWLDLRSYDPVATAKDLRQPMLILQGGRDYQVTEVDFKNWRKGLSGQPKVTFKLYPKLNHLFMAGEGKSKPSEYEQPGHVADEVIRDVAGWIEGLKD